MMAEDRDAVLCDLAETYGITDYKGLPVDTLAALCAGLREDSRIRKKLRGETYTLLETVLLAILDELRVLVWLQTKDGAKGRNRPKSVLEQLTKKDKAERDVVVYSSGEDFMAAREQWMKQGGEENGNGAC